MQARAARRTRAAFTVLMVVGTAPRAPPPAPLPLVYISSMGPPTRYRGGHRPRPPAFSDL